MYQGERKVRLLQDQQQQKRRLYSLDSANKIIQVKQLDKETGIITAYDMRLAVVKPAKTYQPDFGDVKVYSNIQSTGIIYRMLRKLQGPLAVDIETKGTEAHNPECQVVGVGMSDGTSILYFDFATNSAECNQAVLDFLADYPDFLFGHNVFFDGAFLQKLSGRWWNWQFDTYGLYRQLANEGYPQQTFGLKDAQVQLLGWDVKGDVKLDQWLIDNQYIADIKKQPAAGYYQRGDRFYRPRKSEMWRAPASILGAYCGLDCAATWQLLFECLLPSIQGLEFEQAVLDYHATYMDNLRLLVSQQLSGITINKAMLAEYQVDLAARVEKSDSEFLSHPDVRPHASLRNQAVLRELEEAEPVMYKKLPKLGNEPARLKKDGSVSKVWENWDRKRQDILALGPGELTSNWQKWALKYQAATEEEHLNLNSGDQMAWLFYEQLNNPVLIWTDSDKPSTGAKALPGFGEPGKLLKKNKDQFKELGYVNACLEHLQQDQAGLYRIHPQFRAPGTWTCRLAGSGGLNLQQIPKSRGYLDCWHPAPGKAWIDCDHTSLEQVVMAELSQDASLYKIYGPGIPVGNVTARLDALGVRYTIKSGTLEINDEDMHKLQARKR